MFIWSFCLLSTVLCGFMVLETTLTYPNYFSALVGLTDTSLKTHILICFACSMAILWTKFVIFLFLGKLSEREVQVLYQRGWIYLCNIIIFWGTFGSKLYDNPYNIAVCTLSLFILLVLHWLCTTRVRNQVGVVLAWNRNSLISNLRLATLCSVLFVIDVALGVIAVQRFKERDYTLGVFSFTLIDLLEMSFAFNCEYALNLYSAYYLMKNEDEDEWDKLKVYTAGVRFVGSLLTAYAHLQVGLGLGSLMNDYSSLFIRIFKLCKNGSAFMQAIKAKRELFEFTDPATTADLERDSTCVICREDMDAREPESSKSAPKRLRCGHVMHAKCLVSWMAQSASCPTCRQPVKSAISSFRNAEGNAQANSGAADGAAAGDPGRGPGPESEVVSTAASSSTELVQRNPEVLAGRLRFERMRHQLETMSRPGDEHVLNPTRTEPQGEQRSSVSNINIPINLHNGSGRILNRYETVLHYKQTL